MDGISVVVSHSCSSVMGSFCLWIFVFVVFVVVFLWLCPFFKNQIVFVMGLSFDFFVFYYFFLRLYNSIQKKKLSSFKLG